MKKYFIIPMAALMGALPLASCSSDDAGSNGSETVYTDRTFGNRAIGSCEDIVSRMNTANSVIGSSRLTDEQEAYLHGTLAALVDNVIVPTYRELADDVEELEETLHGLTVNTITQEAIDEACDDFKDAREEWERSEAFLMGAASDFDVDPTIDSWPLNRTLLLGYFNNGMSDEALEDQTILGFHALEFILFRNGQPRKVEELKGFDTYKNFTGVSGAQELAYAQTICTLLKQRTFQLQVAWEGETAGNAGRVAVVKAAGLKYTVPENGLSYGDNLKNAGVAGKKSTFSTLGSAIAQVLSDDEGSCAAIANEVGTAKIANPFSAGDISYVESPYSYNSISDFKDNIRSIRNVWYGSLDGRPAASSFHGFFANVGRSDINSSVEGAVNDAITNIGNMPAPFVKYVSTIWNIAFEDDEDWNTGE